MNDGKRIVCMIWKRAYIDYIMWFISSRYSLLKTKINWVIFRMFKVRFDERGVLNHCKDALKFTFNIS